MKKTFLLLLCVSVVGIAGMAGAVPIPFQIGTSSTLHETVTWGPGMIGSYTALGTPVFYLDDGETSAVIDFFTVNIPLALAAGTVEADIDLLSPTALSSVTDQGTFKVLAFYVASLGGLKWGDPVVIPYVYGGTTTGVLTLDLFDICTLQCGSEFTISGTITNEITSTPGAVPIPSVVLLLGTGLIGLAGFKRKVTSAS